MKQNNYYCSPGQKMTSTNLHSAKQECTRNPYCDMFYDEQRESSVFYMCESAAYVWMSSTNSIGSTLYYDGNPNIHIEDFQHSNKNLYKNRVMGIIDN